LSFLSSQNYSSNTKLAIMTKSEQNNVLYINVTVIDHSAAVKRKVGKKIEKSSLPKPLKSIASRTAPKIAGDYLVTPKLMATTLVEKLMVKIPRKLSDKGITAEIEPVFQEGPYVVMQLHVHHVDLVKFVVKQNNPTAASLTTTPRLAWFDLARTVDENPAQVWSKLMILFWICLFSLVGTATLSYLESYVVPRIVQSKMEATLQELLDQKLEKKQLEAHGVVLKECNQARYFYSQVAKIKQGSFSSPTSTKTPFSRGTR
jgi:hypothetical protein